MKNILFLNFNCTWCPHFDTDIEIMSTLLENSENNIFSLSCHKLFNTYCISNQEHLKKTCENCIYTLKRGLDLIGLPTENRLTIKNFIIPKFPEFKTQEELKNYCYDEFNIGFGVYSSLMSITKDYMFSVKKYKKEIKNYLQTAYLSLKNLQDIIVEKNIKEVYFFNGRFIEYYPAILVCQKYNIDFFIHERSSSYEKYQIIKNDMFHRFERYKEEIEEFWTKEPAKNKKQKLAENWFINNRKGIDLAWYSFVKEQKKNSLPENFDFEKENIGIFNSSMDEYSAFDEFTNPIDKNDNNIIRNIVKHFKDDKNKHFYLRIHPNLKNANTTQMKELELLKKENFENLTIIAPDDIIDTYALIENCKKTIVFTSTVGIEATFWGTPSIVAGKSLYENYDCTYKAYDYETLYKLIASDLRPKSKEACYPYAYWASNFGSSYKYYQPKGLLNGELKGINLHKIDKHTISEKIRFAISIYKLNKLTKHKKIMFRGASLYLEDILSSNKLKYSQNILGIIDKNENKIGQKLCGIEIFNYSILDKQKPDIIIPSVITVKNFSNIVKKELSEKNFDIKINENIFKYSSYGF